MTVALRDATADDAERIAAWLNAPWARRFLSSNLRGGAMNAGLVRAALRRPDQSWHVAESDGAAAGLIVLDSIDRADGIANIWYLLGDAALQGRGTMSQALRSLCAANPWRLAVVTAWAGEPNAASLRCLEKAGFARIGRVTGAFAVDGTHDRILFERVLAR